MKKVSIVHSTLIVLIVCMFLVNLLILTGCTADEQGNESKTLSVLIYSDYISNEVLTEFQSRTDVKVIPSLYESTEEMLAKLSLAGVRHYDVIVVSDHAIPMLIEKKLIQPLDQEKIPNKRHLGPMFQSPNYDPGNTYSMPYQWGTVGLMYNKILAPEPKDTWGVLLDPSLQTVPFVLIDSMRDMLGVALIYQGKSINTTDPEELKQAGELIQKAKNNPNCISFEGGIGGKNKIISGQAGYGIVYNGDAVREMTESDDYGYLLPKEGAIFWIDAMVISSETSKADIAHQFIDFILDPHISASVSNFNQYATPNDAAMTFINPEDRDNPAIYPSSEAIAKMQDIREVGEATELYDRVWVDVKTH